MGNWLIREQAKELLAVPDRSTLKAKISCGFRQPSKYGHLLLKRV
jgi:hypothetical protein